MQFGYDMVRIAQTGQCFTRTEPCPVVRANACRLRQGDAEGQYSLGVLYLFGHGVPLDYAQGVVWPIFPPAWIRDSAGSTLGSFANWKQ